MVRLVPWDSGVIFQLQHLLNHAHSIRRTLSLMVLVPHGNTTLGLTCLALIEDMPITVSRISKIGHGATQESKIMLRADELRIVGLQDSRTDLGISQDLSSRKV